MPRDTQPLHLSPEEAEGAEHITIANRVTNFLRNQGVNTTKGLVFRDLDGRVTGVELSPAELSQLHADIQQLATRTRTRSGDWEPVFQDGKIVALQPKTRRASA